MYSMQGILFCKHWHLSVFWLENMFLQSHVDKPFMCIPFSAASCCSHTTSKLCIHVCAHLQPHKVISIFSCFTKWFLIIYVYALRKCSTNIRHMYWLSVMIHLQKLKRIRVFDLSDSVSQMSEEEMKTMTLQTFRRILTTESMLAIFPPFQLE